MNLTTLPIEVQPVTETTPHLDYLTNSCLSALGIDKPPTTDELDVAQYKRLQGFIAHFALQPGFDPNQFDWNAIRTVATSLERDLVISPPSNLNELYELFEFTQVRPGNLGLGIVIEKQLQANLTDKPALIKLTS